MIWCFKINDINPDINSNKVIKTILEYKFINNCDIPITLGDVAIKTNSTYAWDCAKFLPLESYQYVILSILPTFTKMLDLLDLKEPSIEKCKNLLDLYSKGVYIAAREIRCTYSDLTTLRESMELYTENDIKNFGIVTAFQLITSITNDGRNISLVGEAIRSIRKAIGDDKFDLGEDQRVRDVCSVFHPIYSL